MKTRKRDHVERQGNSCDDAADQRDRATNRRDDQADVSGRIDGQIDREADATNRLDLALWTAAQGARSPRTRRRSLTQPFGLR